MAGISRVFDVMKLNVENKSKLLKPVRSACAGKTTAMENDL